MLDQAMNRLREEYLADKKSGLFDRLRVFLSGEKGLIPYAEIAAALGMSEGAVKVAVHRLRKRYGELLRAEIALTVGGADEVQEEIRYLIAATSR